MSDTRTGTIRLVLVDDHEVLRSGLRMLLEAQPDMVVVGEAGDGVEAERICRELMPDVVLMDIAMPGRDGIETTKRLTERLPGVRVLALTMHDDKEYLKQVLAAGGAGYVVKRAAADEVVAAVRTVVKGDVPLHPSMTRALVDELLGADAKGRAQVGADVHPAARPILSERETEVLKLAALGHSNQEVADALCISIKTVETHKARIMGKLGTRQRSELVRYAIDHGLLKDVQSPG